MYSFSTDILMVNAIYAIYVIYVCACNFIIDLTLEQTDAKKVKAEDGIDGKSSEMDLRINQLVSMRIKYYSAHVASYVLSTLMKQQL